MNKGYIKLLSISLLFVLSLTLDTIFNILNIYTLIFFLFIIMCLILFILGYEKSNYRYQNDIILNICIYSVIYIIITNLLGLFVGFNKTGYNLSFLSILENIIPVILIIILSELIRYTIVIKGGRYKTIYVLTLIIFVLLDVKFIANRYMLQVLDEVINFAIEVVLPSISKNIMLMYLINKVGYKPAILYRFIFELPIYFLPIFPDFGIYIGSILQILLPAILLYIVYYNFEQTKNKKVVIKKSKYDVIALVGLGLIVTITVMLSSGWFKYYFLTIGSESMARSINKGDVILVEKLNDEEINSLKVGDVLVFNYSKKIVVHRIIRILVIQNTYYFYTKGDNNEAEDGYPIEKKDIIGITSLKVPYLGYPAVWLNELISR